MIRNNFKYKVENKQNPYEGITSFQHFRGEKLYSDCVVRHDGIAGTETENYECYPVTEGVKEDGRSEGYYPDNSVAYIRVLWKEFEPERKQYNYKFIQDILDTAKAHKQSVMFRIMAHSTCERDDVPEWLKKVIDCPKRPEGMRVKDSPTDERFLEYFGEAVAEIGKHFDANPVLDIVDICLPGSWGEGYNLEAYSKESLIKFVDVYLKYFKNTQLIGQMGLPWLIEYESNVTPVGWRGDGTGSPKHMNEIFPDRISKIDGTIWQRAPVSFEAYWWLGEWYRQGWDIDEIIEKTLGWHLTNFNPKSLPIPFEWKDKVDYWVSKMGYHYQIDYAEYEKKGDKLNVNFCIDNVGVAPIYHALPLTIRLKGKKEYIFDTDVDIRKWLPGKNKESFSFDIKNVESGDYKIEIAITDMYGRIAFATDAENDDDYFVVGKISL